MPADHVLLARTLFGTSLGFHIIFSTLGVGIPLMVAIAEITYALTRDSDYAVMAKRWTRGFTVLLAVGITTGTTVALQLSLLWPKFMQVVGQVIAIPFLIEIFAFFIEALFMSIYVYAADRIALRWRLVSVIFVAIGAGLSAALITDANAFMNTPQGFRWVNGQAVDVRPWQAVFNPALPTEDVHVLVSAYMTSAFITASIAGYGILRRAKGKRDREHHSKALMLSLALGGLFGILTAIMGDASGKFLADYQPEKLAVAEGLFQTTRHAPLVIGGWPVPSAGQVVLGVPLPGLLSWLATGSMNGVVRGLNDFPRDTWPPMYVHTLFDLMVGIGSLLILVAFVAWGIKTYRKDPNPFPRWLMWVFVWSGPLSMVAIECGWIFAEVARQPWTIYKVMRTSEAVTPAPHMGLVFSLFMLLYTILAIGTVVVLQAYIARHPLAEELEPAPSEPKRMVWLP